MELKTIFKKATEAIAAKPALNIRLLNKRAFLVADDLVVEVKEKFIMPSVGDSDDDPEVEVINKWQESADVALGELKKKYKYANVIIPNEHIQDTKVFDEKEFTGISKLKEKELTEMKGANLEDDFAQDADNLKIIYVNSQNPFRITRYIIDRPYLDDVGLLLSALSLQPRVIICDDVINEEIARELFNLEKDIINDDVMLMFRKTDKTMWSGILYDGSIYSERNMPIKNVKDPELFKRDVVKETKRLLDNGVELSKKTAKHVFMMGFDDDIKQEMLKDDGLGGADFLAGVQFNFGDDLDGTLFSNVQVESCIDEFRAFGNNGVQKRVSSGYNFTPDFFISKIKIERINIFLMIASAIALLAAAGVSLTTFTSVQMRSSDVSKLESVATKKRLNPYAGLSVAKKKVAKQYDAVKEKEAKVNNLRNKVRGINDIFKIISMTIPAEMKVYYVNISGNSVSLKAEIFGADPDTQMNTLKVFNDKLVSSGRFVVSDFEAMKSNLLGKVTNFTNMVGEEGKSLKDTSIKLDLDYTVK